MAKLAIIIISLIGLFSIDLARTQNVNRYKFETSPVNIETIMRKLHKSTTLEPESTTIKAIAALKTPDSNAQIESLQPIINSNQSLQNFMTSRILSQSATSGKEPIPVQPPVQQPGSNLAPQQQQQQQQPQIPSPSAHQQQRPIQLVSPLDLNRQPPALSPTAQLQLPAGFLAPSGYQNNQHSLLYYGHNPFIEILRPLSYADDNIVTLNLSHSHIYEIDSEAFVGQRFEHIDLSNNKLGLIHSRSFRIGPNHSRHNPYNQLNISNNSKLVNPIYPTRRPPPSHPKSVTIDLSNNPAIVALSGAFDHIDVPNCLLNFTNSTVELKFGAFKKYFKEHPGHIVDIESVDCCEQEWLLGYKHNFVARTHCDHDPNLVFSKVSQQFIVDSCIAYVTSARRSMTIQEPSLIHKVAALPRGQSKMHNDNQNLTYMILGGTAMILTSLSIYIIFYMFSLKAAFVNQIQHKI